MLNGRLAALNRFLSRSTKKCKAFFQALKKNGAKFRRDEECEVTFQGLKGYLHSYPNPSLEKCCSFIMLYRSLQAEL